MRGKLRQIVLLRKDLLACPGWTLGSLIAQAVHASIDCLHTFKTDPKTLEYIADENRGSMTTVILEVKDHKHITELQEKLSAHSVDFTAWTEQPENMVTAIALKPCLKTEQPEFLSGLSLFGRC